jgi:hypothetical protein
MRLRLPLISFAVIAIIAACDKQDPVANGASAVTAVPGAVKRTAPTPAGGPPANTSQAAPTNAPASGGIAIPAALQGRWGLSPADCTSALGDAKGLLVVNATELRFYESRAVPTSDVQASDLSMNGDFHFTGEGQTWTKYEALQRNRDRLRRTETNPAASYTYAKC